MFSAVGVTVSSLNAVNMSVVHPRRSDTLRGNDASMSAWASNGFGAGADAVAGGLAGAAAGEVAGALAGAGAGAGAVGAPAQPANMVANSAAPVRALN